MQDAFMPNPLSLWTPKGLFVDIKVKKKLPYEYGMKQI